MCKVKRETKLTAEDHPRLFLSQWRELCLRTMRGTTKSGLRNCRPRGEGWMVLLEDQQECKMFFEQHENVSNISFTGDIDDFEQNDWLTIRHDLPKRVDEAILQSNKWVTNFYKCFFKDCIIMFYSVRYYLY